MLNPVLSNFRIEFSDEFWPDFVVDKYNKYLFQKNYPLKNIAALIYESIINFDIGGINLNTLTIESLQNLGKNKFDRNYVTPTTNKTYPGTISDINLWENKILTITLRNSILNWMYFYEMMRKYYKRKREVSEFYINIIIMDSAEIPMIKFHFNDAFISTLPGLSFAYNASFNDSKTIDIGLTFNEPNVEFILPEFNLI